MLDPLPSRRELRAPIVDLRVRQHEVLDIIASGLAKFASVPLSSDIAALKDARGDGLELPQEAALSVPARFRFDDGGTSRASQDLLTSDGR